MTSRNARMVPTKTPPKTKNGDFLQNSETILNNLNNVSCGHVRKCVMLSVIFWTIFFIRFASILYRQIVGIKMGMNCAALVAELFLFCYERNFMLSLSDNNQTDIIEVLTPSPDI